MAYGGGTFTGQNKTLPGTYTNVINLARTTAVISDRGISAAPFELNWGAENTVMEITAADFQRNSKAIFGYGWDAPEMLLLREIFANASKVLCYRLGTGAVKAENAYGEARYPGTRGNDITVSVVSNVDNEQAYDVTTFVDGIRLEIQTVTESSELKDNDFVIFKKDGSLTKTAGTPMTGGVNCTEITGEHHQAFLDAIESYSCNTVCCPASDPVAVALYDAFAKRMRDELGTKLQTVAWESTADHEGVIGVWNTARHSEIKGAPEHCLVYWVAGAAAAIEANRSLTGTAYNGELTVDTEYTQAELEEAIAEGKFMLHNDNGTVRVLEDINTLVTVTEEKGDDFKFNQFVRVADQIAVDMAVLFNTRYLGAVQNDSDGRISLWNDIVKNMQQYERRRLIENFDPETISVNVGDSKKAVVMTLEGIAVAVNMSQLYMTIILI